ncbi:hypothetical protein BDN71DRAFT_1513323 [Pleurotus eryngii]|uniref:Uncharacterized protein n=1 Tax=Pleurotus eryngii TaxID=5323 RepID=A0A9P5ZH39_PLEER|nr:hypothetical protein BDN71DRAFT_1513323 [Pleurotus eryngii]
MGVHVKINQANLMKPPTMGESDVDTATLWEWFNKSEQYFCHKGITTITRVEAIAWGMTGVHAIHWLSANLPSLTNMDWEVYKAHMCMLFLPSDWEHTTHCHTLC